MEEINKDNMKFGVIAIAKNTRDQRIHMKERGVTKEILYEMYAIQNKSLADMRKRFNVSERVLNRWLKESGIAKKQGSRFNFDIHFFDTIDTEEKAYWLGFIWCDGYASTRIRDVNGTMKITERPLKISLAAIDKVHLHNFKISVQSNHPVHIYKSHNFNTDTLEARLTLNNMYFGSILQEKYGLIPHRTDTRKVLRHIPENLERHFLRGIFDADGSISNYQLKTGKNIGGLKSTVSFSTHTELVEWIQCLLIKEKLKSAKIATSKRHGEGSDGDCVTVQYAGVLQSKKIMEFMYQDANVFLNRKREKYFELLEMLEQREEMKHV